MHGGQSMGCDRQGHWPLPGMPAVIMVIRWHHQRTTEAFGCDTQGSRCLPPTTPDRGGSRGVRIPGVPQAVLMDWSDRSPVATVCCVEDWTCLFSRVKPSSVQQPLDRVLLGYYRNIICCWCYKIMQANCVWKWQLLWRLVCKLKNSRNMILFKNFILTLF